MGNVKVCFVCRQAGKPAGIYKVQGQTLLLCEADAKPLEHLLQRPVRRRRQTPVTTVEEIEASKRQGMSPKQ